MKCERARELFSEYVEGSIDYALTATVRSHIDGCDDCRSDLRAFRRTWDVVSGLPEVEPPSSFRHDVVMRAARLQHEQRKCSRQGFLGLTWDYLFGRLLPARAIAIAVAGAALAAVLLNVPQGIYGKFAGVGVGGGTQVGEFAKPPDTIEAGALSNAKADWQTRIGNFNALWVSVDKTDCGEGSSYYNLALTINNKALARDITNRIPAQVYILPVGTYGVAAGDQRKPIWTGDVLRPGLKLLVPGISNSRGESVPVTLLIKYRFRKANFAKIVFIPTEDAQRESRDTFILSDSRPRTGETNLYAALQTISRDHGKTIIANASLGREPNVVDLGGDRMEDALRKVLQPVGLTWAYFDDAVYVDRQFRNVED